MELPDSRKSVLTARAIRDRQTYAIIGAAMEVHRILGSEFLEPVYQAALEVEFGKRDVPCQREVELPVYYKNEPLGVRYRADFVCFGEVLIELKALERVTKKEENQIIHYLIASRIARGLLFNFGTSSLQYRRFAGPTAQSVSESTQSVDKES